MSARFFSLLALLVGAGAVVPASRAQGPGEPADGRNFANLYSEGNYLGDSGNLVGFGQLRAGRRLGSFELYGDVRVSTDTRSDFRPLGQVFNDNFVFVGAGADYLPAFASWLRLRVQAGHTFNLGEDALRPEGFDLLAGWVTYNEFLPGGKFRIENYSEGFYYRRYRNGIAHDQLRLLWTQWELREGPVVWGAYPITMAVINYDTEGVEYNRFLDWRTGIRLSARTSSYTLLLTPMYVVGTQLEGSRTYGEFRVLGVAYLEF